MKIDDAPRSEDGFLIGILESCKEFGDFFDAGGRLEFVGSFGAFADSVPRLNENVSVVVLNEVGEKFFRDAFGHEFFPAFLVNNFIVEEHFKSKIFVEFNIRAVNEQRHSN